MADLLEAGVETLREHMDVVVQGFRGGEERRIGHHHAGGEIVRERDAVEPPRCVVERAGAADDGLELRAAFGQRDLERNLEGAARRVDQFGNEKLAAMAVEAAQGFAHHVDRHDAGLDRMFFAQACRKRREQAFGQPR